LWVGGGTRFSPSDLATLRAIAFHCAVVVASAAPSALQFLAEQLGPLPGVSLRATADSPSETIHSAVVEAAGGQVVVTSDQPRVGDPPARKVSFTVSALDERIVVFVRNPQAVVAVARPSGVADPPPRVEPVADGGRLFTFEKTAGGAWAGGWQLTLTADGPVRVWAFGSLQLRLAGAGGRANGRLSVGVLGGRLADVTVESRPLTTHAGESSTESVVVRAIRSPLSDDHPAAEGGDPPTAPRLDLTLPKHPGVPAADLTVSVSGRDPTGLTFHRRVRWTHPLLGRWTRPRPTGPRRVTVPAELTAVRYAGGAVTGVVVRNGTRERTLRVDSPALRAQLAVVAGPSPRAVLIQVAGDELLGLVHLLAPADVSPADGPSLGIDHPVPDRAQAESPDPDYPQASRYVQAKHYRAVADTRGVSRVVIHITDGGPKVDGTVGWFLNPTRPNGDPLPVSAHYVIGQNGDVVQMVRNNDVAYHSGSANGDSIGIEHCARQPRAFGPTDAGLPPSVVQYEASAALVRWLCEGYGIPMDREHILGHAEADTRTTHTACPNAVWDWDYYMELVTSGMSQPPG
jgi:N-acetyl-anhydromuramyl-L-alanine amidase AmpD